MWPATGSSVSFWPRKRSAARASTSTWPGCSTCGSTSPTATRAVASTRGVNIAGAQCSTVGATRQPGARSTPPARRRAPPRAWWPSQRSIHQARAANSPGVGVVDHHLGVVADAQPSEGRGRRRRIGQRMTAGGAGLRARQVARRGSRSARRGCAPSRYWASPLAGAVRSKRASSTTHDGSARWACEGRRINERRVHGRRGRAASRPAGGGRGRRR